MTNEEIAAQIKTFLEKTFPRQDVELTPDTDLLNDWFVDSLGIVQTVVFLEEHFDCNVKAQDVNVHNFFSINTLTTYVEGQQGGS
jgi:acyl carrier protein